MFITEKKQVLLEIIEEADEKLTGLLLALANEYNDPGQNFSEEELASFEESRDAFFKSGKKGYTVEEAHNRIRNKRNSKNK